MPVDVEAIIGFQLSVLIQHVGHMAARMASPHHIHPPVSNCAIQSLSMC